MQCAWETVNSAYRNRKKKLLTVIMFDLRIFLEVRSFFTVEYFYDYGSLVRLVFVFVFVFVLFFSSDSMGDLIAAVNAVANVPILRGTGGEEYRGNGRCVCKCNLQRSLDSVMCFVFFVQ